MMLQHLGVRPMATYPPLRSEQLPYSSVQDNPECTVVDMWVDLLMGRRMLFAKLSRFVGWAVNGLLAFFRFAKWRR